MKHKNKQKDKYGLNFEKLSRKSSRCVSVWLVNTGFRWLLTEATRDCSQQQRKAHQLWPNKAQKRFLDPVSGATLTETNVNAFSCDGSFVVPLKAIVVCTELALSFFVVTALVVLLFYLHKSLWNMAQHGHHVASSQKALMLEMKSLQDEPVEGFKITLVDESDMYNWEVAIFGPPNTHYEGGYFKVSG